jgi:hypothetical protein
MYGSIGPDEAVIAVGDPLHVIEEMAPLIQTQDA